MFVYFRSWASVESTRFEENVLNLPEVRAELTPFYCVVLEHSADHGLAAGWDVHQPPAVVFLDDQGRLLQKISDGLTRATLQQAIAEVRQRLAASQPAPSP